MNKDERLAAAKKKLKEFQKQQRNLIPKSSDKEILENSETHLRTSQHDLPFSKQELPAPTSLEDFQKLYIGPTSSDTTNSSSTQQPSLANYFQRSSGNEFFFDTVHKRVNGDTNSSSISSTSPIQNSTDNASTYVFKSSTIPSTSTFFPLDAESNPVGINFPSVNHTVDAVEGYSTDNQISESNAQELNALKLELELANSRIKMQSDALDIITAAKEDLQSKLTKAIQEIDSYERNTRSLTTQLEENFSHTKQLEVTIEELKHFKENVAIKEFAIEQSLSDLQEKSDELAQSLKNEKEINKALQSQLDETQSNYSLLALKFQQLGIEVNSDPNKDYKSVHEECESWKRNYNELEGRLKATLYEKERTEDEYRQFVVNLKQELENATIEVRQLSDENQVLASKISSQTEHISSLERQVQKTSTDANKDATIVELQDEIQKLRQEKEKEQETNAHLAAQLVDHEAAKRRILELENQIENLKADMTNAHELQIAVESNKVAASQAIAQNAKMKSEFEQLHQLVQILNEEKIMLSKMLEEEKTRNANLAIVTKNENGINHQEKLTNDAAINTDAEEEGSENGAYGKANLEAMLLLQEKFKSVLDKMADLTDEKQQLEHLVMQLQSETETIEEYVALYQKQRSLLQQRARETDLKMENVSQEKERLLNILRLILTTDNFDCAFVKQLVESNLSVELSSELVNRRSSGTTQQFNSFLPKNDNTHHPSCPCCSGQLITV